MRQANRLTALRVAMKNRGVDAYIVPSSDPHQSEYVADHWKSRTWLSGFTGSAATLVVTQQFAGLWTDSRYFLQAEEELKGSKFTLQKQGVPHAPEHADWLAQHLPNGATVGCDGALFSVSQIRHLAKALPKEVILDTTIDLISEIWKDRPDLPQGQVFVHQEYYAGKSIAQKLQLIRHEMQIAMADFYLITTLDDIAWTFNIRCDDVAFNPVAISYAIIGQEIAYLFIDEQKMSSDLVEIFRQEGIFIKPYDSIQTLLRKLPTGKNILVHQPSINIQLFNQIQRDQLISGVNIVAQLKTIKNATEIKHIRQAMRKDGVALLRLYRWLEKEVHQRIVSEYELAQQLADFRSQQSHYVGESFPAIVGYRGNGAIVHYRPLRNKSAVIKPTGILLLDSGGQYLDGTTDITRTTTFDTPTSEQKRNFTLVLKGHIALATAKFPQGTKGAQLDVLARLPLWQHHLNYGHGTGHGVGFFLNVHEGPQGISPAVSGRSATTLQAGMLTSNEPGFYKTNAYGIRIENLVLCVEDKKSAHGQFLTFETLTLFPIDLHLVDEKLLTGAEIDWLNAYHERVFEALSPALELDETDWLREKCRPIVRL
ncbi:MAG: aminopeptidase P family protein [Bacteroidota bacterium]